MRSRRTMLGSVGAGVRIRLAQSMRSSISPWVSLIRLFLVMSMSKFQNDYGPTRLRLRVSPFIRVPLPEGVMGTDLVLGHRRSKACDHQYLPLSIWIAAETASSGNRRAGLIGAVHR